MSIEVNAIKHIQHTCKWCKWKISFFPFPLSFTSQIYTEFSVHQTKRGSEHYTDKYRLHIYKIYLFPPALSIVTQTSSILQETKRGQNNIHAHTGCKPFILDINDRYAFPSFLPITTQISSIVLCTFDKETLCIEPTNSTAQRLVHANNAFFTCS